MSLNSPAELDEPPYAPAATAPPVTAPVQVTVLPEFPELPDPPETRGCLYALSQPPLMLFLAVIAVLLGITGFHDLFAL